MDDQELTPWQEINPLMALAPRPEPQLPSLARLQPATSEDFRNELTACLALVVPVGMTEEARREWLAVAWETLKHLPADLLAAGCRKARQTADHPSKIVPAIIEATSEDIERRREFVRSGPLRIDGPSPKKHVMDRRGEPMDEADCAELNRILENLGAQARYRCDGSRFKVEE